jgi:hypothetical protein
VFDPIVPDVIEEVPAPASPERAAEGPSGARRQRDDDEISPQDALDPTYARRVLVASVVLVALIVFVIVVLVVAR